MPVLPPVTTATLPSSFFMTVGCSRQNEDAAFYTRARLYWKSDGRSLPGSADLRAYCPAGGRSEACHRRRVRALREAYRRGVRQESGLREFPVAGSSFQGEVAGVARAKRSHAP